MQGLAWLCTLAAVIGAVLFFAAFSIYAWTCAPAIGWLDSSEFVAAAAGLGVPHSPGHPLQAILGHAATLMPLGDVAFRVNVLSAALSAAAVVVVYRSLLRLGRGLSPTAKPWVSPLVAVVLSSSLAVSSATWMQAVRAEVYALELLLLAGALYAAVSYSLSRSRSALLVFSLITGLALATHHYMTLTFAVPAAVLMLWTAWPRPGPLAASFTCAALGLASFAYLPIRASVDPLLNWGNPSTIARLGWTISGRAFTKSLGEEHASGAGLDAVQVVATLIAASPLLPLLALLGLYLAIRIGRGRKLAACAAGMVLLASFGRIVLGFDPETPDHHAYLLPALLGLAVLAALGIHLLVAAVGRHGPQAALIAALSVAGFAAFTTQTTWQMVDQGDSYAADEVARMGLEDLPPRAVALTSYFQTSFRLAALQAAEGQRPDVAIIDRSFLSYPGERETALRKHPALASLIESGLEPGRPVPLAALRSTATERPVAIELHFNLDRGYHQALHPAGAFASFETKEEDQKLWSYIQALRSVAERSSGSDQTWAKLHLLWTYYVHLLHACERREHATAQRLFAAAMELAPEDAMLQELATGCGIANRR